MRGHELKGAGWGRPTPYLAATRALERARWHFNRLRCMSRAEIGHRVLRALSARAESWGLGRAEAPPPADLGRKSVPWIHCSEKVEAQPYLEAAGRIAAGRFDVYALRGAALGSPPRWNRDPRTGIQAPLRFGKLLDYRDRRLVGDVRYLWELNRHYHLVTLAQAHALGGDARHVDVIRRHLDRWMDTCPYGMGPNWSSALEAAIRLINWSVTWQLLGGASSPLFEGAEGGRFRNRWLGSVYRHARFVRGHLSLYSSANNHLVGEAAGLFIAGITWPHWPQAREWLADAAAILEREALQQNAPDGVNREQSVAYHQFELDLLLLPLLAGKANGHEFSLGFTSRIEAMMEYLASIMDCGGNIPAFGDSDDSLPVKLVQGSTGCRYRSALATGAILFRRGDFKAKAGALDDKARWLFGNEADTAYRTLDGGGARLPVHRAFPEGGYYILGSNFETTSEVRLVVDAGPLGYPAIAAHGHADALAFTLSAGGMEMLIDSGTYTYDPNGLWRSYFRGTSAHNTLRIDGVDQSEPGGNFMWLKKAAAGCSRWQISAESDIFEGWQDGYSRLPDPVMHRRRITFAKQAGHVVIEDFLQMSSTHEVELFFHCSEQCRVVPAQNGYLVSRPGRALSITLPQVDAATTRVYSGSVAPVLGWVSKRYDEKQPAPTIVWRARLARDTILRSEIRC